MNDSKYLEPTPIHDPAQLRLMLEEVQFLYESEPYKQLKMWPATRDYLLRQRVPTEWIP